MISDGETLANLIAQEALNEPSNLTAIVGRGTCNQVFLAEGKSKSIIIRLNNDRDEKEFFKETWCMNMAGARGLSVSRALGHGSRNGWHYSVQSFEGPDSGKDHVDQIAIWHWLGKTAAEFHKIEVKGFGDALTDQTGQFSEDWKTYVKGNLAALDEGEFSELFSPEQLESLRQRFASLEAKEFSFGLCHGDLKPGNVVLDGDRITLIDWGCAQAHIVPHFDFWRLLRVHSFDSPEMQVHDFDSPEIKAFCAGYGLIGEIEALRPEIENLILLCSYDLMRWARDRAPDKLAEKTAVFQVFLKRFGQS